MSYTPEDRSAIVQKASESIEEAMADRKKRRAAPPSVPATYKPLTEVAALERLVWFSDKALQKYEVKFEDGEELNPEEERVFLSQLDNNRKLQTTLQALRAKADHGKKTPVELAVSMLEAGIDLPRVREMYSEDKAVMRAIKEWEKKQ